MNLVRNAATVLATTAVRIPIQFAASVVLARYLSVEDRGLYAVAVAFGSMLTFLMELGWGPATIYRLRRAQALPARVTSSTLILGVVLSAVAIGVCLPFQGWISHRFLDDAPPQIVWLALLIVPFNFLFIAGGSMARALDRFGLQNGTLLLVHATRLGGVVALLVFLSGALQEALLVFLASEALGMLVVMTAVARQTGLESRVHLGEIRAGLSYGLRAYLIRTAAALHDRFDMFMIAYFLRNPEQAAFYAVAISLRGQLRLLPEAISRALFPQLAGVAQESSAALTARAVRHSMAFVLVSLIGMAAAAPLVPLLYGAPYAASIPPFLVLLVGMALFSMQRIFSNYFGGVGRQRPAVQSQLLTTGANVILNLLLIPQMGILGAALANLISNAMGAIFITFAFCRDSGWGLGATFRPRREDVDFYRRRLAGLRQRLSPR